MTLSYKLATNERLLRRISESDISFKITVNITVARRGHVTFLSRYKLKLLRENSQFIKVISRYEFSVYDVVVKMAVIKVHITPKHVFLLIKSLYGAGKNAAKGLAFG